MIEVIQSNHITFIAIRWNDLTPAISECTNYCHVNNLKKRALSQLYRSKWAVLIRGFTRLPSINVIILMTALKTIMDFSHSTIIDKLFFLFFHILYFYPIFFQWKIAKIYSARWPRCSSYDTFTTAVAVLCLLFLFCTVSIGCNQKTKLYRFRRATIYR